METHSRRKVFACSALAVALISAVLLGLAPQAPAQAPPGPGQEQMAQFITLFRGYVGFVDEYRKVLESPSGAGVAAVVASGDLAKAKGPDAAIAYYEKVLPGVKDEAVQRAIRLQLADLCKSSGKPDRALEHFERLMQGKAGAE